MLKVHGLTFGFCKAVEPRHVEFYYLYLYLTL
jgi:hypothetical protein